MSYPDQESSDRRRNGRIEVGTLLGVAALVVPGFAIGMVWWGKTEAKVDNHEIRITKIESTIDGPISDLKTAVAVLSAEIKNLRQQLPPPRDPRRDLP